MRQSLRCLNAIEPRIKKHLTLTDLPQSLRSNISLVDHISRKAPVSDRPVIHAASRLYEVLPALCYEGKVDEVVANILFRAIEVIDCSNEEESMLK